MTLLLLSRTSPVIVTVADPSDGMDGLDVISVNDATAAPGPPGTTPPPTSVSSLPLQAPNNAAAATNNKYFSLPISMVL
jgi:hypothetical protein